MMLTTLALAWPDTLVGRVEMAVSSLVVGSSSDKVRSPPVVEILPSCTCPNKTPRVQWLALKAPETAKPAGLLHALIHPRTKRTLSKVQRTRGVLVLLIAHNACARVCAHP
jgi:hypothetical protein